MRFVRIWVLVFAVVFALNVSTAGAHSEVFERAPAIGQVTTGTVDHVDISYFLPVTQSLIELQGPDGNMIAVGASEIAPNGQIASVEFEPLTAEGRYTVTHVETSIDGDTQLGTFSFIFNATEGTNVASLSIRGDGPNWAVIALAAGVIMFLAGIFWPNRSKA